MKLDELVEAAAQLSEEDRASLASRLLHGLETPTYHVSDGELRRRQVEAEADPSAWLSFDQLVSSLKER